MTGAPCKAVRDALTAGRATTREREHLAACAGCAAFDERLRATRKAFADHHAGARPDAGFAGRVAASVQDGPADRLGRAALQLLPATVALLAILAWITVQTGADRVPAPSPTDNVLSWVADPAVTP